MNCSVTLSPEEFKIIHNTLWDLEYRGMDGRVGAERIREALKGAYEQDNRAFETKHDHYRSIQERDGFRSIWSLYEVNDLDSIHPYHDAEYVVYDQHWGESGETVRKIAGPFWSDLYRAADEAIRASGDSHHLFIESFTPIRDKPGHLRLSTGS